MLWSFSQFRGTAAESEQIGDVVVVVVDSHISAYCPCN